MGRRRLPRIAALPLLYYPITERQVDFHAWSTSTLLLCLMAATLIDLFRNRIPNILTGILLGGGILLQSLFFGLDGFLIAIAGSLVGMVIFLFPYAMGGMGAGDVKLVAAIGAHVGPLLIIKVIAMTLIFGGVLALLYVILRGNLTLFSTRYFSMARAFLATRQLVYLRPQSDDPMQNRFPYAMAILLGTVFVLHLQGAIGADSLHGVMKYLGGLVL